MRRGRRLPPETVTPLRLRGIFSARSRRPTRSPHVERSAVFPVVSTRTKCVVVFSCGTRFEPLHLKNVRCMNLILFLFCVLCASRSVENINGRLGHQIIVPASGSEHRGKTGLEVLFVSKVKTLLKLRPIFQLGSLHSVCLARLAQFGSTARGRDRGHRYQWEEST